MNRLKADDGELSIRSNALVVEPNSLLNTFFGLIYCFYQRMTIAFHLYLAFCSGLLLDEENE